MTTTAVPSLLPEDFTLNIENLDKFSNSTASTFANRLGVVKPTLAGSLAMVAADVAEVEQSKVDSQTAMAAKIAAVEAVKNTAINTTIPAKIAEIDPVVAASYVGQAATQAALAAAARVNAELAQGIAFGAVNLKPSTTAGITDTTATANKFFSVIIAGVGVVYENVAGAAVERMTLPDAVLINQLLVSTRTSKNLFNPATVTPLTYILVANGNTAVSSSFFTSDWLPVSPLTVYTATGGTFVQYDAAKAFIGTWASGTATASNAAYVRFYIGNAGLYTTGFYALNYLPAFDSYATARVLTSALIAAGMVKPIHTTFAAEVVAGKNLYNPSTVTTGFVLAANGARSTATGYEVSDFTEIEPNTTYSRPNSGPMVTYDADYRFLAYVSGYSITTGATAKYLRTSWVSAYSPKGVYKSPHISLPVAYAKGVSIPDLILPTASVRAAVLEGNTLKTDISVAARNLGFLTRYSPNLFDKTRAVLSMGLNRVIGTTYGDAIAAASTQFLTDYIDITAGETYRFTETLGWAQYDASGVVVAYSTDQVTTFTAVAGAVTFRNVARTIVLDTFMLTKASEWPAVYAPYDRFILPGRIRHTSAWLGKKITWMGTSIPAGGGYPGNVGENLLANVTNIALSGGSIRAFSENGTPFTQSSLIFKFTLELADIQPTYGPNIGLAVNPSNYAVLQAGGIILTQAMIDALVSANYVARLMPHVLDTDLFVFDYGINDRNGQTTFPFQSPEATGYDRKHFTGAMNFIYKKIYDTRKAAGKTTMAIFVTHHSRNTASPNATAVVDAQIATAKYWGCPVINLADNLGVNDLNLLDYIPDGLHFTNGSEVEQRVTRYITSALRGL